METIQLTAEQQNVVDSMNALKEAYSKRDLDAVLSCYEQDATFVFSVDAPVTGVEGLKEAFRQTFMINPVYEFKGTQVFVSRDIASYMTTWKMTGAAPNGRTIKQTGFSVTVLRKQADGKWLISLDNPQGLYLIEKYLDATGNKETQIEACPV